MSGLALSFEIGEALAVARNLGVLASRLPTFQRRAIGTLRRRIVVEARRDIQREYNLKAGRITQDLSATELQGGVRLRGAFRGIGLRNFSARDLKSSGSGVSYSIMLGIRGRRPHAFFASLSANNLQVVERKGEKRVMTQGRYKGQKRQPLVTQYGATVAQMLGKGRRPERLAEFARGVLRDDVERQIQGYAKGRPIPGADN